MLDQAFDAAERGRAFPDLDPSRGGDRGGLAVPRAAPWWTTFYADRQHAAEAALHLLRGDRMAGMARQAGIKHFDHTRMGRHCLGDALCRAAGALDPQIERPHAAHQQIGLHIAEDRAAAAARRPSRCQNSSSRAASQRSGDDIAVAVQVFGRRMHDDIGAKSDRLRQHRGRRGAVDGELGAGPVCDLGRAGDVGYRPQRVRRRLDPDESVVRPGVTGGRSARRARWCRQNRRRYSRRRRSRRSSV